MRFLFQGTLKLLPSIPQEILLKRFRHLPQSFVLALVLWQSLFLVFPSFSWAGMVGTESVIRTETQSKKPRQQVMSMLQRKEVMAQLETFGVSREEALARVQSFTDEEIDLLAETIGQYAVGGDDTVEAVIYSFVILLVILLAGFLVVLPFIL
jgi:hypothetical protein